MKQVTPGDWPSGGSWTVFVLRYSPQEMAERFGVVFEPGSDDFDSYEVAAFRGWSNQEFWLFRYKNSPLAGTDVLFDTGCDRWLAFRVIRQAWGFDVGDLAWVTEWESFPGRDGTAKVALLPGTGEADPTLSTRELQVAEAAAGLAPVKEIAKQLRISPSTVSGHLQRIYLKLGVHSRAELREALKRRPQFARSA